MGMVNAMATLAQKCSGLVPDVLTRPECERTVLVIEDDRFVREAAGFFIVRLVRQAESLLQRNDGYHPASQVDYSGNEDRGIGDTRQPLNADDFLHPQNIETKLLVSDFDADDLKQALDARVRLVGGDDLGLEVALAHALFLFTPRFGPTPAMALITGAPWDLHRRRKEHALGAKRREKARAGTARPHLLEGQASPPVHGDA